MGTTVLNKDLEFWMTQLPEILKTLPIIHLAIPGSHNTMTYTIRRTDDVGPDEPPFIRALGRYLSVASKPIIYNWSITQNDDVKKQLDGGIRYLDLRVATKPNEGNKIYFLHGLYGSEVKPPLKDVADWLSAHPNELIVLDFQHFYLFTRDHHRQLIEMIYNIFQGKLCPMSTSLSNITLKWASMEQKQVFVIYRNASAQNHRDLWPSGVWPTPWPDTIRTDQLIHFLDTKLQSRSAQFGFISQCLLTPSVGYVLKHLCGSLHRDLVPLCQKAILPWISTKRPGSSGINVVIADFVSDNNFLFSKTVIQSNAKLLDDLRNG